MNQTIRFLNEQLRLARDLEDDVEVDRILEQLRAAHDKQVGDPKRYTHNSFNQRKAMR